MEVQQAGVEVDGGRTGGGGWKDDDMDSTNAKRRQRLVIEKGRELSEEQEMKNQKIY